MEKLISSSTFCGTGRRKTAIARVTLTKGTGKIVIKNWKMPSELSSKYIALPLEVTEKKKSFDVIIIVSGGGINSRLDAIRLAISRALIQTDPELKSILRKSGLITRDYREKERKKPGLRRARRAPQWAKR